MSQHSTPSPAPLETEQHKKVPMLQLLNDKLTKQSKAGAKTSPTICTETAKYTIENVTNTPFRQMHLFFVNDRLLKEKILTTNTLLHGCSPSCYFHPK